MGNRSSSIGISVNNMLGRVVGENGTLAEIFFVSNGAYMRILEGEKIVLNNCKWIRKDGKILIVGIVKEDIVIVYTMKINVYNGKTKIIKKIHKNNKALYTLTGKIKLDDARHEMIPYQFREPYYE
jgi:hypothetical protein